MYRYAYGKVIHLDSFQRQMIPFENCDGEQGFNIEPITYNQILKNHFDYNEKCRNVLKIINGTNQSGDLLIVICATSLVFFQNTRLVRTFFKPLGGLHLCSLT